MQQLGKGLGEAIGEGLDHDHAVVVMVFLERSDQPLDPAPRGDGEGAEVIGTARAGGSHVVGQAAKVGLPLPFPLLAQEVEPAPLFGPRLVGVDNHVIAVGIRREEPVDPVWP